MFLDALDRQFYEVFAFSCFLLFVEGGIDQAVENINLFRNKGFSLFTWNMFISELEGNVTVTTIGVLVFIGDKGIGIVFIEDGTFAGPADIELEVRNLIRHQ